MKRIIVFVAITALSCFGQSDQQAQSQTNAGASTNTSVTAGQSGANAQSNASVSGSQNAETKGSRNRKGSRTSAAGTGQANANGSAGNGNASLQSGTTIDAVLTKSIDAKKAKEGQEVIAKTTHEVKGAGEATIPKGAKLVGHVTKASARAKGDSESSLGIIFDRAEIGKGREVPVHAVIQAVAAARTAASSGMNMGGDDEMGGNPGMSGGNSPSGGNGGGLIGGTVNGVGHTVGNTAGGVGQTAGNVGAGTVGAAGGAVNNTAGGVTGSASSTLNASSQGAIGLPGYVLQSTADASTQGSIITSTSKDVKLDSGTQMVLKVVSQ